MTKIKLISQNASLTCCGVTLTQESKIAEVSDEIATTFLSTGKVVVLPEPAASGTSGDVQSDAVKLETSASVGELAECKTVADYKDFASKHGIDISGCKTKAQLKTACEAGFEP